MSRVLALLVSVALVVGALVVTEQIPLGGVGGGGGGSGGALALTCATELRAACDALAQDEVDVTVEPAGRTAAALAGPVSDRPGLWLVPAPWPEVAALQQGSGAGADPEVSAPLARSPLVLAVREDRGAILDAACGAQLDWDCLGSVAGEPWREIGGDFSGSVRPGHLDPTVSATGLLVLGQAATSFADRVDLGLADLDRDDFFDWFAQLEGAVPDFDPSSGSQLEEMILRGTASFDVVGTTEAEAARLLGRAANRPDLPVVRYADPVASADVVLAAYPGSAGLDRALDRIGATVREALGDSGWRVDGRPPGQGVANPPPLPDTAGLPSAGFLVALAARWEEVTR